MQPNKTLATLAVISLGAFATHAASSIVYSNATTYTGTILNPGLNEVGDEIVLGSGPSNPRYAESFRFEYYGNNFSGNEKFELRFYQNDGDFLGNNTYKPASVFYDSTLLDLPTPTDPSGRATLQFDLTYTAIGLPDRFTWSIQFSGIDAGETAGVSLYNPATVGFSENDYWFNNAGTWELRGTNVPINFGASLTATSVPEPSAYMLAILGGICGLALINRRRNKKT